jgi:hypothetical protein
LLASFAGGYAFPPILPRYFAIAAKMTAKLKTNPVKAMNLETS